VPSALRVVPLPFFQAESTPPPHATIKQNAVADPTRILRVAKFIL